MPEPTDRDPAEPTDSSAAAERADPAERGRLGFSRATISLLGVLVVLAFLLWVFLP